jgi:hypothetical protein
VSGGDPPSNKPCHSSVSAGRSFNLRSNYGLKLKLLYSILKFFSHYCKEFVLPSGSRAPFRNYDLGDAAHEPETDPAIRKELKYLG